jgi:hypothetical protein
LKEELQLLGWNYIRRQGVNSPEDLKGELKVVFLFEGTFDKAP